MQRVKLLIVISNPWTYRNLFCTKLIEKLADEYELIFCCANRNMEKHILAMFPASTVNIIPFLKLSQQNSNHVSRQFEIEAVVIPGRSRAVRVKYYKQVSGWKAKIYRMLSFRYIIKPFISKKTLHKSMNELYEGLLKEEPYASQAKELLNNVKPDFIWLGTTFYRLDLLMLAVAYEMKMPIITTVLGWDNLSTKYLPPVPSNAYFVWGDTMEKELGYYFDVIKKRVPIFKVGSPQFDVHAKHLLHPKTKNNTIDSRFDINKPIIFFGGSAAAIVKREPELVNELITQSSRCIDDNLQWFVRLHPKDNQERWQNVKSLRNVVLFQPCSHVDFDEWIPNDNEMDEIVEQISMVDVVVNNASTITLDACALNQYVINVRYEPGGKRPRRSDILFEEDHMRHIIEGGDIPVCNTIDETIDQIRINLHKSNNSNKNRQDVVRSILGPLDGKTSNRIQEALKTVTGDKTYKISSEQKVQVL